MTAAQMRICVVDFLKEKQPLWDGQSSDVFANLRQVADWMTELSLSFMSGVMADMGSRGGTISGSRRRINFTQEQRTAMALKAAKTRWGHSDAAKITIPKREENS